MESARRGRHGRVTEMSEIEALGRLCPITYSVDSHFFVRNYKVAPGASLIGGATDVANPQAQNRNPPVIAALYGTSVTLLQQGRERLGGLHLLLTNLTGPAICRTGRSK